MVKLQSWQWIPSVVWEGNAPGLSCCWSVFVTLGVESSPLALHLSSITLSATDITLSCTLLWLCLWVCTFSLSSTILLSLSLLFNILNLPSSSILSLSFSSSSALTLFLRSSSTSLFSLSLSTSLPSSSTRMFCKCFLVLAWNPQWNWLGTAISQTLQWITVSFTETSWGGSRELASGWLGVRLTPASGLLGVRLTPVVSGVPTSWLGAPLSKSRLPSDLDLEVRSTPEIPELYLGKLVSDLPNSYSEVLLWNFLYFETLLSDRSEPYLGMLLLDSSIGTLLSGLPESYLGKLPSNPAELGFPAL